MQNRLTPPGEVQDYRDDGGEAAEEEEGKAKQGSLPTALALGSWLLALGGDGRVSR